MHEQTSSHAEAAPFRRVLASAALNDRAGGQAMCHTHETAN
jgi:hypothetical protein